MVFVKVPVKVVKPVKLNVYHVYLVIILLVILVLYVITNLKPVLQFLLELLVKEQIDLQQLLHVHVITDFMTMVLKIV